MQTLLYLMEEFTPNMKLSYRPPTIQDYEVEIVTD